MGEDYQLNNDTNMIFFLDYKIVVLGAGGVGKSLVTVQFVQGVYVESYDPTIEDLYRKQIEIDGRACDLEILDTAGVAQFTAMRELYIKSGKGFLLVYSVTDENSLKELMALREQVARIKDSDNVPMVLIGNKCDLENDRVLSIEDGIKVSQDWGLVPFYETSAMYKTNIDEAFVDVVRQIMRKEAAVSAEKKLQKENMDQKQEAMDAKPVTGRKASQSMLSLKSSKQNGVARKASATMDLSLEAQLKAKANANANSATALNSRLAQTINDPETTPASSKCCTIV